METSYYHSLVFYLVVKVACEPIIEMTFFDVNGIELECQPWFFLIIIYIHGNMIALCHKHKPIALNHPGTTNIALHQLIIFKRKLYLCTLNRYAFPEVENPLTILHTPGYVWLRRSIQTFTFDLRPCKQHSTHYKDHISLYAA